MKKSPKKGQGSIDSSRPDTDSTLEHSAKRNLFPTPTVALVGGYDPDFESMSKAGEFVRYAVPYL